MAISLKKLGTVSRLLNRAFRKRYTASFVALIFLGLIGGIFEGVGIASVIPLFYLMTDQVPAEGINIITRFIAWLFGVVHLPLTPAILLAFIVLLFIAKGFTLFIVRYTNARIVSSFEKSIRRTLLRRTLRAQWSYLMHQKVGYLESILLYDVERGAGILNTLVNTIILSTTFIAYTLVALTISWPITLGTLVLGGIIFFSLKPVFFRIRQLQNEAAKIQKDVNHHVAEHMTAAKSIKAMALEYPVVSYGFELFEQLMRSKVRASFYRQSSLAVIEPIGFLVIAALFLASYKTPGFSIISFAIIMYLVQKMFAYVNSISGQIQVINESYPYLKTIMDWRKRTGARAEKDLGTRQFIFNHELTFEHIAFEYRPDRSVLADLTLTIPQGQLIGLIGPSGAGKTTLVDMLLRLFDPTRGRILVDGMNIQEIHLQDWREHIGYVPQDAVLLNSSVRENIRFYSHVSEDDIITGAKAANIHETILALPQGYDTLVGERGVNLSGGQRQRIVLARALARNPSILILDEATSAIDAESEHLVQEAITSLRGKTTVIVITHRLSTTQYLDRLVVLGNGAIQEDGIPQELAQNKSSYLAKLLATSTTDL